MEISRLPQSFFSKAKRKFKKGRIELKKGKLYFEDLNGNKNEIEFSPEWERLDGSPFKLSVLKSNVPVEVRIRVNEDCKVFFAGSGKVGVSKEFTEKMAKKGEKAKLECGGILIQNGQVVLLSSPVMFYDSFRLFMGECDIIEKADMKKAIADAHSEKMVRLKNKRANAAVDKNRVKTAWNDRQKAKQSDIFDNAEWIIAEQVYNKEGKRIGFLLLNINEVQDKGTHFVDLETTKHLCDNLKIKNVQFKNGKFVGNGNNGIPINELPQTIQE